MKINIRQVRKRIGDIVFAAVFATVIGALFMKSYAIPTSSMEGTLLVGDHMFVSKFHYGARLPQTPLQIPLTHQKIWGTEIPSYLECNVVKLRCLCCIMLIIFSILEV